MSTDSKEYAKYAIEAGAEVPFLRPKEISLDNSTDYEFIEHALDWLSKNDEMPDFIVHLRPTTPLRDPLIIDSAINTFRESQNRTSLRSVHEMSESSYKNFEIIIIDNFSSDKSFDVAKNFIDPRINLFQFQNNGIIAASRNFGIKKSNGKYLAFLDSDDYWMKDKLSKSVKVLEKGADFIYHDCILFSKDFKKRRITKSRSLKKPI